MTKHKILYMTLFPHIGGGETSLLYLLEKLDRVKYESIVLVTKTGQVSARLKKMHVNITILNLPGFLIRVLFIPGMSLLGLFRFYRLARAIKPSIIHLNHPFLAIYAGAVGKLLKIPVVATSHGIWDSVYFYQDIINAFCIDRLLPITPEVLQALTKRGIFPKSKTQVVYLGVDTNKFKPAKNKSQAKKRLDIKTTDVVVTMACRFDFGKNHIAFLKVAKDILKSTTNVRFVIVGDTKIDLEDKITIAQQVKKQLDDYINQYPTLKKHVLFTDFQKDMAPIYHATDILFSSSLSETLPMSFLEGASCGLPIIALENISTKKIIKHNKNGFLVPPGRSDLLYQYLLMLLHNPGKRRAFGEYSRSLVIKNFSIGRYVKEIESIYDSFLHDSF